MMLRSLLAVLPLAAAAPSPASMVSKPLGAVASESTDTLHISYHLNKTSSMEFILASNSDNSRIYGRACGNKLNTGFFADLPISVELGTGGHDVITVGGVQISALCMSKNDDEEGSLSCQVPGLVIPDTAILDDADLHAAAGDCFPTTSPAVNLKARNVSPTNPKDNIFSKRGMPGLTCYAVTSPFLVGDGDPHQVFLHKQLSENMSCGSASACTINYEQSKSYTITWTSSISAAGWITGGFEVQKSLTTGNAYGCEGDTGSKICLWYKIAHTSYRVQQWKYDICFPKAKLKVGDSYLLYSPNKNNKNANGGYYCRTDSNCHSQGHQFWDLAQNHPGGP